MVYDSITETFFRTPSPNTKLFERFFIVHKQNIYIYLYISQLNFNLFQLTSNSAQENVINLLIYTFKIHYVEI